MPKLEYMVPADAGKPEWANSDRTQIDIAVIFPHLGDTPVRYTAAKSDPGWEHSEEIFGRAAAGEFGKVKPCRAPSAPVPETVSRAQFGRELRKRGVFDQAEAVSFVSGTGIPTSLQRIVDALPTEDARDDAALLLLGSSSFSRNHPMTAEIAKGLGWNTARLDDVFREAAKL